MNCGMVTCGITIRAVTEGGVLRFWMKSKMNSVAPVMTIAPVLNAPRLTRSGTRALTCWTRTCSLWAPPPSPGPPVGFAVSLIAVYVPQYWIDGRCAAERQV